MQNYKFRPETVVIRFIKSYLICRTSSVQMHIHDGSIKPKRIWCIEAIMSRTGYPIF
jgi:hypothetical protein